MSTKKQGFASLTEEQRREISTRAGRVKHPNKGFGSLDPEQRKVNASEASKARWAKVRAERLSKEEGANHGENTETESTSSPAE